MSVVRAALILILLLGAVLGCGVPLQERPERFTVPSISPTSPPPEGAVSAVVFLVRDARIVPVERAASDLSLRTLIGLLAGGPSEEESERGVRSALVPRSLEPHEAGEPPAVGEGVIRVAVTRTFTTITGEDQLLATAQLVWTVTQRSPFRGVQVVVEGEPIELPTDNGLAAGPVRRSDFASVAPRATATGGPSR